MQFFLSKLQPVKKQYPDPLCSIELVHRLSFASFCSIQQSMNPEKSLIALTQIVNNLTGWVEKLVSFTEENRKGPKLNFSQITINGAMVL